MSVEVEVIYVLLDYNLLLGRIWTYAMSTISSVVLPGGSVSTQREVGYCKPTHFYSKMPHGN